MVAPRNEIKGRGGLGGGAAGHTIEPFLVTRAEFSSSFCNIEHDRWCRAVELVFEVSATVGHLLDDPVNEVNEGQRTFVDVEFVVVEWHAWVIGKCVFGLHKTIDSAWWL